MEGEVEECLTEGRDRQRQTGREGQREIERDRENQVE